MTRTRITIIGVVGVILLAWIVTHVWLKRHMTGCADVRSTPMGTVMDLQGGAYRLRWDDKCPSGVGWTR